MSFNGSGTFVVNSAGQPVVANTVISATVFNALTADLATGLSTCITKDGQTTVTANIPFGNNKITALGAGTAASDAANLGQVQSTAAKLVTVTGTDTITGTMSPALTAYAAGQLFYFIANAANTGAVTINIDGLGAKSITRDGSTALAGGDINSGEFVVIIYDGTRFQMINAANSFGNTTINGTLTVTGNTALQANVSITSTLSVGGTFAVTGAATLGSTLAVTGKSDLPTVSTASINAAVALITTGTVTNLTASGASIASANIGNLQFTAASIASINAGVAVVTNLTATSASIASMNAGVALLTTATVTSLTATGASVASANVGTAVVTGLTVTGASIASVNAGTATLSGNLTLNGGAANCVLYLNGSKAVSSTADLVFDGTNLIATRELKAASSGIPVSSFVNGLNVGGYDSIGFAASPGNALAVGGYRAAQWSAVELYTSGTLKAVLDTSGNLGIGTTSPIAKITALGAGTINAPETNTTGASIQTSTYGITTRTGNLDLGATDALAANIGGSLTFSARYQVSSNASYVTGKIGGYRENNTGNTAASYLAFATTTSAGDLIERMRLDSSGNLGLGVTPSAGNAGIKAFQIGALNGLYMMGGSGVAQIGSNYYFSSGYKYGTTGAATNYETEAGAHKWYTAPSGTAGNNITFTQAMTLDASGNLLIGTTSATGKLTFPRNNVISWENSGTQDQAIYADGSSNLILYTSNAERARITAGGYFKASNTGTYQSATATYHELRNDANANTVRISNTIASGYTDAIAQITFTGYSPNTTNSWFLFCNDSTATRAEIRSNGGLANYQSNNVDLSDARTKNSITPAASMWDKIGALEIVTYKYNDQTHDDVNLGVIAQQVESVEPVWVDADGFGETPEGEEPLKTVYTKDITFAAIKALQEAMARIEQLEAKVAQLEAR